MRLRLLITVFCVAGLAGCASGDNHPDTVDFHSPASGPSSVAVGEGTLDFTAPKLGGGQVVGSEFVGKDVAMWFWAPW